MNERAVDVAIIGAGTAGLGAYRAARETTDSVLLIQGGPYGTTCARVGCMPSKLLIAAAEAAQDARHAERFGIRTGPVQVDGAAVMERVRRERDRFVSFVLESVASIPEEHRLEGHARFLDDHTLQIDDHTRVTAGRIVIATGSRPAVVPLLEAADDRLIVNDDVFEWTTLPESVAVFGPGVIGLELGQALGRLGVRVRMFGVGGAVGPVRDDDIRAEALTVFNEEFPLDPDANVQAVKRTDEGVAITFADGADGVCEETFDYLLAATGRRPNVDGLDLGRTSLALDDRGMPQFDRYTLQCGDSHVFIAGDANNDLPLLHEASDEGRIAGRNAGAWPEVRTGLRRTPLAIVFTDPQIATAGLTIQQVDERCRSCFAVGEVRFANQGRARVAGRNRGLLRVYGEQGSGLFLGAEMFGPAAEHIGHLLAWCAQKRMTVSEMLDMPYYHPVIEEGLRTALRDLNHKLHIGRAMLDSCMECGPGA
jgi:dihydrolipoamide dehydrogenase